jgi:hypothetical protein
MTCSSCNKPKRFKSGVRIGQQWRHKQRGSLVEIVRLNCGWQVCWANLASATCDRHWQRVNRFLDSYTRVK